MEKELLLHITGDASQITNQINKLENTKVTIKLDGDFGDLMRDIQSTTKTMSTIMSKAFNGVNLSGTNKIIQSLNKVNTASKVVGNTLKSTKSPTIDTSTINKNIKAMVSSTTKGVEKAKSEIGTLEKSVNGSTTKSATSSINIKPLKLEADTTVLDTIKSKIDAINKSIAGMKTIKLQENGSTKTSQKSNLKADQRKFEAEQKSQYNQEYTSWWAQQYKDADNVYDKAIKKEKDYYSLAGKIQTNQGSQNDQQNFNDILKERSSLLKDIGIYEKLGFANSEKSARLEAQRNDSQKAYAETLGKHLGYQTNNSRVSNVDAAWTSAIKENDSYNKLKKKYADLQKNLNTFSSSSGKIDESNLIDKSRITELANAQKTISNIQNSLKSTKLNENGFKQLKQDADGAMSVIKEINSANNQRTNKKGTLLDGFKLGDISNLSQLKSQMESVARATAKGKVEIQSFNNATKELNYRVTDANKQTTKMKLIPDELSKGFRQSGGIVTEQAGMWGNALEGIGKKFKSVFEYTVSAVGIYQTWNVLKQGIGTVKDFDTALTELRKTSAGSAKDYNTFIKEVQTNAPKIGTTSQVLTESAADWSRLGYSLKDSSTMAKNTGILKNVSEFENISDATNSLISIMQAYDVSADQSMGLIDKLNNVGNNYAISTDEIATSLQRSSAALVAAGNTIDESIALTTSANTIVQDPESVGAGLKTVSLRLRGTDSAKKELEESGEDVSDFITNVSKLQGSLLDLTKVSSNDFKGFDILKDDGSYKSTYQILLGIGKIWKEIGETADGDKTQANILEKMFGKNRAQIGAAILQNPDLLEKSFNSSSNSDGSAAQELDTYLNSIEAHVTQLKESFNQLWVNSIESDAVKGFVDMGTGILNLVNNVGLLKTAFAGLSVYATSKGVG